MVRDAGPEDFDHLVSIEMELFPENSLNERSLAKELTASKALVFGRPLRGYILMRFDSELIDILRVGVFRDFRGQGIGRALVEEVLFRAYMPVMLTVKTDNHAARRLYTKLGFKPVGWMPQVGAITMLWHPTSDES